MKKDTLYLSLLTLLIVACTILLSDGLTYLITALMALTIIGAIRANRSSVMKLTRWAKAKPGKAQGLITGIQFILMGIGIITGKNLKELGYEFTDTTAYVFTVILVIGFLSVPFRRVRSNIVIPKELNRQRLGYLSVILSSLILMALIGNRIEDVYPNSPITHAIETVDQWIFSNNTEKLSSFNESAIGQIQDVNYSKEGVGKLPAAALFVVNTVHDKDKIVSRAELKKLKKAKRKALRKAKKKERKFRRAAAGGSCAVAILLIILLLAPLCAGICLIIGAWGTTGAGAVIGGLALTAGSVWAMIKVGKWCLKE